MLYRRDILFVSGLNARNRLVASALSADSVRNSLSTTPLRKIVRIPHSHCITSALDLSFRSAAGRPHYLSPNSYSEGPLALKFGP